MILSLVDRSAAFPRLLDELKSKQLSFADPTKFPHKITSRTVRLRSAPMTLADLDLRLLADYNVFPPNVLVYLSEWEVEHREMGVGDVILQQANFPALRSLSVKMIVGVRIIEMLRSGDKVGFRYGTLEGHVERGTASFYVTLSGEILTLTIETFSEPANRLNKLVGPIAVVPYQALMTRLALAWMIERFMETNPLAGVQGLR